MVRYEPDTKLLYIGAKAFKDFCVRQQINYKSTLKELEKIGVFKGGTNKRMSKGMKISSPVVRTLKFDTSGSDTLQIETMLTSDEDRDSVVSD